MKLPMCFHWQGEVTKRGFTQLHQEEAFLPNIFENSFSFAREVASLAISKEAEAMPNGV